MSDITRLPENSFVRYFNCNQIEYNRLRRYGQLLPNSLYYTFDQLDNSTFTVNNYLGEHIIGSSYKFPNGSILFGDPYENNVTSNIIGNNNIFCNGCKPGNFNDTILLGMNNIASRNNQIILGSNSSPDKSVYFQVSPNNVNLITIDENRNTYLGSCVNNSIIMSYSSLYLGSANTVNSSRNCILTTELTNLNTISHCILAGIGHQGTCTNALVGGSYANLNSQTLLAIGNATDKSKPHNAFSVLFDGTAYLYKQGTTNDSVVRYDTLMSKYNALNNAKMDKTGITTGTVQLPGGATFSQTAGITFNSPSKITLSSTGGALELKGSAGAGVVVSATPAGPTNVANKKYVDDSIANLVNSSPETLDTLKELADALGNDPEFSTTVLNKISTLETNKMDKFGTVTEETSSVTVQTSGKELFLYSNKGILIGTKDEGTSALGASVYTSAFGSDGYSDLVLQAGSRSNWGRPDNTTMRISDKTGTVKLTKYNPAPGPGSYTTSDVTIQGVATPKSGNEAANKSYVDGLLTVGTW